MNLGALKWFAVLLPTVVIAFFEYVRHNYLLDVLPMSAGNWVTAGVALITGLPLVGSLFAIVERMQLDLEEKKRSLAVMEERDRIARDLHDGICQALFYANVQLKAAEDSLRRGDVAGCAAALAEGRSAIHSSHDDVRQTVFNLKMAQPPDRGLAEAVRDCMEEFRYQTGLEVRFDGPALSRLDLTPEEEGNLLKILQEALWNVRKHARANTVEITAQPAAQGVEVRVRDDGQGFDPETVGRDGRSRFGMRIMRERVTLLGGEMEVRAAPGQGTEIVLRLPARHTGGVRSA